VGEVRSLEQEKAEQAGEEEAALEGAWTVAGVVAAQMQQLLKVAEL
jgi:hypothetical protein